MRDEEKVVRTIDECMSKLTLRRCDEAVVAWGEEEVVLRSALGVVSEEEVAPSFGPVGSGPDLKLAPAAAAGLNPHSLDHGCTGKA